MVGFFGIPLKPTNMGFPMPSPIHRGTGVPTHPAPPTRKRASNVP